MVAVLVTPEKGRGAWPSDGQGGTLASTGDRPGSYFRAPASDAVPMIGLAAFRADRDGLEVSTDLYATWRHTVAVQDRLGIKADGIWGFDTDKAVKAFQSANGLTPDGVYGPKSSKALWLPVLLSAAKDVDSAHPSLIDMLKGHVGWESGWDGAAVGRTSPEDLSFLQINGPAHPDLTADQRLDPGYSFVWGAEFVSGNLVAMKGNVRDAIAAFNLGRTGATNWVKAGRPDVWTRSVGDRTVTTKVKQYIDNVWASR